MHRPVVYELRARPGWWEPHWGEHPIGQAPLAHVASVQTSFLLKNSMNDQTIIILVAAGTHAAFSFMVVRMKAHQARRPHSLGDMCKPALKEKTPPAAA